MTLPVTFVVAVNNEEIFQNNFAASPLLQGISPSLIIVQRGFDSAASAYNDAVRRSTTDLVVFAHQDVVFPLNWITDLGRALEMLSDRDPEWGVLGCYGETLHDNGRGYLYSPGRGFLGKRFDEPAEVQTLDEVVLIIRKSSELRFDPDLPHFHFYGTDICMAALERGMKSYAICALCIHNSQQNLILPKEFYQAYSHVKQRWMTFLPIQTTCIRITKFDSYMYRRRLQELYLKTVRRKYVGATRARDGRQLLREAENLLNILPDGTS